MPLLNSRRKASSLIFVNASIERQYGETQRVPGTQNFCFRNLIHTATAWNRHRALRRRMVSLDRSLFKNLMGRSRCSVRMRGKYAEFQLLRAPSRSLQTSSWRLDRATRRVAPPAQGGGVRGEDQCFEFPT